ncbi:hypothetical protein PHMEG_00024322, partial [Phytophthora megakarya]
MGGSNVVEPPAEEETPKPGQAVNVEPLEEKAPPVVKAEPKVQDLTTDYSVPESESKKIVRRTVVRVKSKPTSVPEAAKLRSAAQATSGPVVPESSQVDALPKAYVAHQVHRWEQVLLDECFRHKWPCLDDRDEVWISELHPERRGFGRVQDVAAIQVPVTLLEARQYAAVLQTLFFEAGFQFNNVVPEWFRAHAVNVGLDQIRFVTETIQRLFAVEFIEWKKLTADVCLRAVDQDVDMAPLGVRVRGEVEQKAFVWNETRRRHANAIFSEWFQSEGDKQVKLHVLIQAFESFIVWIRGCSVRATPAIKGDARECPAYVPVKNLIEVALSQLRSTLPEVKDESSVESVKAGRRAPSVPKIQMISETDQSGFRQSNSRDSGSTKSGPGKNGSNRPESKKPSGRKAKEDPGSPPSDPETARTLGDNSDSSSSGSEDSLANDDSSDSSSDDGDNNDSSSSGSEDSLANDDSSGTAASKTNKDSTTVWNFRPYINYNAVEKFNDTAPKEDRSNWWERFTDMSAQGSWPDKMKIRQFRSRMAAPIRDWYAQLPKSTRHNWKLLPTKFKKLYCRTTGSYAKRYFTMKMRLSETAL